MMDPKWGDALRCPSLGDVYVPMGTNVMYTSPSGVKKIGRLIEVSEVDSSRVKIRLYCFVEDDENIPPQLRTHTGDEHHECCQGVPERCTPTIRRLGLTPPASTKWLPLLAEFRL
jgi:hypothetical protein